MDLHSELSLFNEALPVEEASMPPASWYTEQEFLDLEEKTVFSRTWQLIGRKEQLKDKMSYISGMTGKTPWVLTKDEEGHIRGFYNVCPHKGREVVTDCGSADQGELVCGYHAWRFNCQGNLKSAPQIAGIKNFERDKMGLTPLNITEWGPWIFMNGDPSANKPELTELNKLLEKRNWEQMKYHSSKEWIINCNWKVVADNYLDGGYHIPFMHPSLDGQLDMKTYKTTLFDGYSIQSSGATSSICNEFGYDPQKRIGAGSIYAWLFPNFMINVYGDCMDINYVTPLGPNKCKVLYEFYFAGHISKDFISESLKQSDVTQIEDIEICESVQRGLESGIYRPGRYAPRIEHGEYQFHQLLKKAYKSPLN